MNSNLQRTLRSTRLRTFRVAYRPNYQHSYPSVILRDYTHPLHLLKKRQAREADYSGLWWDVSVGDDASKTRVVKTWMRRRLKNAFTEELKHMGFDENGKIITDDKLVDKKKMAGLMRKHGEGAELTGTVSMYALSPLVTAKYVDVRKEVALVVDILVRGLQNKPEKEKRSRRDGEREVSREAQRQRNIQSIGRDRPPSGPILGRLIKEHSRADASGT